MYNDLSKLLSGGALLVLNPGQIFSRERTAMLVQGSLVPQVCNLDYSQLTNPKFSHALTIEPMTPCLALDSCFPGLAFQEKVLPSRKQPPPTEPHDHTLDPEYVVLNDSSHLFEAHNAPSLLLRIEDFFEADVGGAEEHGAAYCDLVAGPKGAQLIVS